MYGVSKLDVCEDVALVSFHKIPLSLPVISHIFGRFAAQGINIDMISQTAPVGSRVDISFSCLDKDLVEVLGAVKELRTEYAQLRPLVSSGNCKLQLFGAEMRETPGVFAKAMDTLAETDTELLQITTSEVDISLLIGPGHIGAVTDALKSAFHL